MPSDAFFSFEVTVGGIAIPEYTKDGKVYVESNLYTTVSYEQEATEYVDGTLECQAWPVTPYQVRVTLKGGTPNSWAYLKVDGVRVGKHVVRGCSSVVFEGFEDRSTGEVRELLFSLPRFPRNKDDKVIASRSSSIGTIEVEICDAIFVGNAFRRRFGPADFLQATKKDCGVVTEGKYTMSTTKRGRIVTPGPYNKHVPRLMNVWHVGGRRSCLTVHYRMGHTLQDMGFNLKNYVNPKQTRSY